MSQKLFKFQFHKRVHDDSHDTQPPRDNDHRGQNFLATEGLSIITDENDNKIVIDIGNNGVPGSP